jgi:hypothetical protein
MIVNIKDCEELGNTTFRSLMIGDVFICLNNTAPYIRSSCKPNVYIKLGTSDIGCNALDLTNMSRTNITFGKYVKKVSKAELNIEI